MVEKIETRSIINDVKAELRKDRVKEAKAKLKRLYKDRESAVRVLANCEREITDYLEEIEQVDTDVS